MDKLFFQNKHIIIVHGYTASSQSHWFPWLKQILESQGAVVTIPSMPNSFNPDPVEWLQYLEDLSLPIDKNTIFIGHSLGCISVLRFLNKQCKKVDKIGGYILVSGFAETLPTIPCLKKHTDFLLDYDGLVTITEHRVSIISLNDKIVNSEISIRLSDLLKTESILIKNAGHFLERDGYKEFFDILPILYKMK